MPEGKLIAGKEKSGFPVAFLAGAGIVLLLIAGVYLLTQPAPSGGSQARARLPMGAVEQAYARNIHFVDLKMSRVANFLNQEVTLLFGVVSNDGQRSVQDMEVTVEFRDQLNQVVLRETHRLLGARAAPLPPGQRREFELTFEHMPADWNRQYPTIRVRGLVLE